MKLKNLVFAFFVLTFLSSNSFGMKKDVKEIEKCEKLEKSEKEVEEIMLTMEHLKRVKKFKEFVMDGAPQEYIDTAPSNLTLLSSNSFGMQKEAEKKEFATKGLKLMHTFKAGLKNGATAEDVDATLSNVIRLCLFEAKYKVKNISEQLKKKGLLGKVVQIPGMSFIINWVSSNVASYLFNFDGVIKDSESITNEIKEILIKEESVENTGKQESKPVWFNRKIDFVEESGKKELKVKFLDPEYKSLEVFEKENPETCEELLCFGVEIAKRKQFLINALKKAGTYEFLHNVFYDQLSGNVPEIEGEIKDLFFPKEQSKGKEIVLKK